MNQISHTVPVLVSAGVYDSSLLYSSDTVRTKNRRVSLYEIDLPIGNTGFSHFGNDRYRINEQIILCAKPGQIRYTELPYKCYYLHFLAEDPGYAELFSGLADVIRLSDRERYRMFFERLIDAFITPCRENEIYIQGKLLEILSMLLKESRAPGAVSCRGTENKDVIRLVLSYIDEHFGDPLTLDDMASHVHLSSIYFHNLFKAAVGQTPHRYLLNRRLTQAKKMLAATDFGFARIADACGFPSQSYFNYVFKREFGETPRRYRTKFVLSYGEETAEH